jgi:EAL domain-containing protein (putative c-di-GMP-specific phosphodiesterase class I)
LRDGELRLHYQPRVDGTSGAIVGMEALSAKPSDLGALPPARFVPMAES